MGLDWFGSSQVDQSFIFFLGGGLIWKVADSHKTCQETEGYSVTNRGFCFVESFGGINEPPNHLKITGSTIIIKSFIQTTSPGEIMLN